MVLVEAVLVADMVAEVSSPQVVHHEVEVHPVLECALHVDEERVFESAENASFVEDRLYVVFLEDPKCFEVYFLLEISFMAQSLMSSLL